jgi:flagellar hook-associated protein 3 FlgL
MTRIATADGWNSALLNLMRAQQSQFDAQKQVSTQKVADDLKGFGRGSETLTAMRSSQARLNGFIQAGESVKARLATQDSALNQVGDAAQGARQAITEALASGRGEGLMSALQQQFQAAVDGLNARHNGRYVFGGGLTDQQPVTASTLSDLTVPPAVSSLFQNDQLKSASQIDEATTVQTGFLASDLGTDLFNAFKAIQAYDTGPSGPLNGQLSDTQRAFLQGALASFDTAHTELIDAAAQNGSLQKRVDTHLGAQKDQADALEGMVGQKTDVDLATAITKLEQAQQAVQASSQMLASLRNVSLLDYLR